MKLSKSDFPLMRRSVLAICASVAISAVVLYSSGQYAEKTQRDLSKAQSMLKDARNRLAAAHEDQENMAIYAEEYGALSENKIIGDNEIKIDYKDVFETAKQRLDAQFRMYSPQPMPEDQLAQYTATFLQEKENANRIFDEVNAHNPFQLFQFQ